MAYSRCLEAKKSYPTQQNSVYIHLVWWFGTVDMMLARTMKLATLSLVSTILGWVTIHEHLAFPFSYSISQITEDLSFYSY